LADRPVIADFTTRARIPRRQCEAIRRLCREFVVTVPPFLKLLSDASVAIDGKQVQGRQQRDRNFNPGKMQRRLEKA